MFVGNMCSYVGLGIMYGGVIQPNVGVLRYYNMYSYRVFGIRSQR